MSSPRAVIVKPVTKTQSVRRSQPNKTAVYTKPRSRTSFAPSKLEQPEDNTNYEELREKYWNEENLDEIEDKQIIPFINHLKLYASDCATHDDFATAKKASSLCEKLKKLQFDRAGSTSASASARSREAASVHSQIEEKYNQRMEEHNKKYDTKMAKLRKKHDREMENFEKVWTEEKPLKYRKPSQRLLQLNLIKKNLIIGGEFDRAEVITEEIKALTETETIEAQQQLVHDYHLAKAKLQNQHNAEIDQLNLFREKEADVIKSKREKEEQLQANRENVLRAKEIEDGKKRQRAIQNTAIKFKVNNNETPILELKPPNDPSITEEEEKQKREKLKMQKEFQQKTIANLNRFKYTEPPPQEKPKKKPRKPKQVSSQPESKSYSPRNSDDISEKVDEKSVNVDDNSDSQEEKNQQINSAQSDNGHELSGSPSESDTVKNRGLFSFKDTIVNTLVKQEIERPEIRIAKDTIDQIISHVIITMKPEFLVAVSIINEIIKNITETQ